MRVILLVLFLMIPVAAQAADESIPQSLKEILEMRNDGGDEIEFTPEVKLIRPRSVQEAAYRLGIQSGAVWRNNNIRLALEKKAFSLDAIYSFRLLLSDGKILPPVIVKSDRQRSVTDKRTIQTGVSYKIIKDARMVSVPPTWRDYLFESFSVRPVDEILYPRDRDEIAIWEKAARAGWEIGCQQADRLFAINLRKLTRDVRGMILFRLLAGQGFVSLPKVDEERVAIQVGEKTLDLNQTSFTISGDARFQEASKWKPFLKSQ